MVEGNRKMSGTFGAKFFDASFYLGQNLDVTAAVLRGDIKSALDHFQQYGRFENRAANANFDAAQYLLNNQDVLNAVTSKQIASAWDHFVSRGVLENRGNGEFSGKFNDAAYLAANADVAAAVQAGAIANGYQHYLLYGQSEGRAAFNFNEAGYLAANPDVADAVRAGTVASGYQHYALYGVNEGRDAPGVQINPIGVIGGFDEEAYLAAHTDVAAAVTAGAFANGFDHYKSYGQAEGRLAYNLSGEQINLNAKIYTLTASAGAVNEGDTVLFTLQTTNVAPGARFDYAISGVSASDVAGGLSGTALIGADGKAVIAVQLAADRLTEVTAETLTLTVAGQTKGVSINDTSINPTYTLTSSAEAVNEGDTVVFTLQTTNVDAGARFDYVISGVSAADVVGGLLTGTAVVDANGKAEIRVPVAADLLTEVTAETLTLTVAGQTKGVSINDTSVSYTMQQALTLKLEGDFPEDGVTSYGISATKFNAGDLTVADAQDHYQAALSIIGDAQNKATLSIGNLLAWGVEDTAAHILAAKATPFVTGAAVVSLVRPGDAVDVAMAVELVLLSNFDNAYTVADTLANLSAAPNGLVSGALSYALTNAPGQLPDLTAARWELAQGATNAADYPQTFALTPVTPAVAGEVDEGATVEFVLTSQNGVPGTSYNYSVTGVNAADIDGAPLTGSAMLNASGQAVIELKLAADGKSEGFETLSVTVTIPGVPVPVQASVRVNDTSIDPQFVFTVGIDRFVDANAGSFDDNTYIGRVNSSFLANGETSTFQAGDAVDGGQGENTLYLTMDPGAIADGVQVSNIQNLSLRLNADTGLFSSSTSQVFMSDWDGSLEQINIRSNKSNLVILEQQTIAAISISDQSVATQNSSYTFSYAAGVLDGDDDTLSLSLDNVNGEDGSTITLDTGVEALSINVADRLGAQYASDVDLIAPGVADITVTAGRAGQTFTLNANVATGAALTSTAFAGDLNLTSADIKNANLGSGSDTVTITGQADDPTSLYQLGAGNNSLTIGSVSANLNLAGDVTSGDGNDTVTVNGNTIATLTARSSISVGNGTNTVTVTTSHAGEIVGGDNTDTVTAGSTAADSSISVGNGTNTVTVTTSHAGEIVGGDNADTVTVASTAADSSISVGNGTNTVTVTTNHAGEIVGGDNADTVTVGNSDDDDSLVTGTITTGDGSDGVFVYGNVTDASINLGDGNGNVLIVTGNISRATPPATIVFGDGNNNLLDVGGNITDESVQFGGGSGNRVELAGDLANSTMTLAGTASVLNIGNDVNNSTITFGDGENVATIGGDVENGSTITFGDGSDQLTRGDGATGSPKIRGTNELTSISMGDGDDHVIMIGKHTGTTNSLIKSGALLDGGLGDNDQLTIRAVDDLAVIARDTAQQLTINLARTDSNNYAIGDVVTVTIASTAYSYTVRAADIIQGNGVATSNNVAVGVAAAITGGLTDARSNSVITLTGTIGNADVAVSASVTRGAVVTEVTPTVIQIANAEIAGFETLNLVATNPLDVNNNGGVQAGETDNERISADISADFALITGVQNVNLVSQVETIVGPGQTLGIPLVASGYLVTSYTPGVGVTSGTLTTLEKVDAGDPNVFTLTNINGSEAIRVEANEITATGNRQVDRISIGTTSDTYKVGDIITVTIGGVSVSIEVTESELTPGNLESVDANIIATKLAAQINAATAGVQASVNDNLVYIAGEPGENVGAVGVTHARPAEATIVDLDDQTGNVTLVPLGFVNLANTAIVYDVNSAAATNGLTVDRYQVGDVLTFNIGAGQVTYVIQAADLESDCNRVDLDTLTANVANAIATSSIAGTAGVQGSFGGVIAGVPGTYSWTHTREINAAQDLTITTVAANLLQESATDDATADVTLTATRAAGSTDSTMELTLDGRGDFDLNITGNSTTLGYTDLAMTLADGHDHTIDLNGGVYTGTTPATIVGNFSNSVTVVDEAGRSTAGQNIVLSDVLARTVNTTGADANFTIDQYTGIRNAEENFVDEVINVTTGTGDDHLTTLAQSALETSSTIDLGTGSNTLSLGWGEDQILAGSDLAALADMNYSGSLTQFNILNSVLLGNGSATELRMPGGATGVEGLSFFDVDVASSGQASLTIEGAASTFHIESANDFAEDNEDRIVLEVVGAQNLSIQVGDEVNVALNGADLRTVGIIATVDIDFVMNGSQPDNNNFVNLTAITLVADDEVDAVISHVRGGATLSVIADANRGGSGEATISVSHVTLGDVSVFSPADGGDFAELNVSGTVGTTSSTAAVSLGNVAVTSNADARLFVENNIDANVNVSGAVDVSSLGIGDSQDVARLVVQGNIRANVSLADDSTISLEACGTDDNVRVTVASNTNNFLPEFGNPDQAAVTNRSYAINLGAIQADAGQDAVVSLTDNDDDTYYGDLSVTIDSVDLFAYRDAALTIGGAEGDGNNSATIVIGDVNMVSQEDGSLAVTNNDGRIYDVTAPGFGTRRELDFADITLGNVSIDADAGNITTIGVEGDAFVTITDNDLARVTVGTIDVDAGGDATFSIGNNDDTTVTTQGVTINAEATDTPTLTFSISDNDRVDNGATTLPPLASSVTINGDVTLTAPTTTTVININDNDGLSATARSTVTVNGNFTSTSGDDITATINDNDLATVNLGGSEVAPTVNLTSTAGASTLTIDGNEDTAITLASTTLEANGVGNAARLDIGNVNAPGFGVSDTDSVGASAATSYSILVNSGIISSTNFTDKTGSSNDFDDGLRLDPETGLDFDIDWFKVQLLADTTYQFSVYGDQTLGNGGTEDPTISLYRAGANLAEYQAVIWPWTKSDTGVAPIGGGNPLIEFSDDDLPEPLGGDDLAGAIIFRPSVSGEYYIDIRPYSSSDNPGFFLLEVFENPVATPGDADTGEGTPRYLNSAVLLDTQFGGGNINTDVTLADLRIDSNDNVAELLIRNNAGGANDTDVTVTGATFIDGSTEANLSILGNVDVNVDLSLAGTVKMDARAATGDATVGITGNRDTTVEMGLLDVDAGDEVDFDIRSNIDTDVRSGNIDIDAGGAATFDVVGNTGSATNIELAVVRGAVTSRGTIAINAATVGNYAAATVPNDGDWGFLVSGNSGSEVFLGDVTIGAADGVSDNSNDVTLGIFVGEDGLVDVGNITISADNDVFVGIDAGEDTIQTGDIVISSGNEVSGTNVSSDLFFAAETLQGNNLNDNTEVGDNGQQITLTANSRGTGEGYVYAAIATAPDLTTLTVSGTNAEVYLSGIIGGDTAGNSFFTLDLSGLTGEFDAASSVFDPLGSAADNNRVQDDGSYVETWRANFGTDVVSVVIGSGDLIYNAQHSDFGGSPSYVGTDAGEDWNGAEGWFSLNSNSNDRYLSPVVAQQSFTINGVSGDPTGPAADLARMHSVLIETGNQEFAAVIDYYWDDDLFDDEFWDRESVVTWYEFNGASYVERSEAYVEAALGGVDITYQYGTDGDNSVLSTTVTITGDPDGSAFDYIIAASRSSGDGDGRLFDALSGGALPASFNTTPGVAPADGVGNLAKETFTFTGSEVGEVIIGGFNPGAWGSINPDNGRLTDQLDFSQFDWNGNGEADDAGLVSLSDFSFTLVDNDGYFADVVIDFIGGANLATGRRDELRDAGDFESVRLVGVGEFNNALQLVQDSIFFA